MDVITISPAHVKLVSLFMLTSFCKPAAEVKATYGISECGRSLVVRCGLFLTPRTTQPEAQHPRNKNLALGMSAIGELLVQLKRLVRPPRLVRGVRACQAGYLCHVHRFTTLGKSLGVAAC
jgi:hypothetical protein